jgi:hypothetical protein
MTVQGAHQDESKAVAQQRTHELTEECWSGRSWKFLTAFFDLSPTPD